MEMLEKVERLREKANVSYEAAKAALEQAGGDLLDAMILLERQGKVKAPSRSTFSTKYEEQAEYVKVRDKVEEQEKAAPNFGRTLGRLFRRFIGFIKNTSFQVIRGEKTIINMPTILFAILLFFFWEALAPIMVIALFFGIRYSFKGQEEAEKVNTFLNRAGAFADDVKEELKSADKAAEKAEADAAAQTGDNAAAQAAENTDAAQAAENTDAGQVGE